MNINKTPTMTSSTLPSRCRGRNNLQKKKKKKKLKNNKKNIYKKMIKKKNGTPTITSSTLPSRCRGYVGSTSSVLASSDSRA